MDLDGMDRTVDKLIGLSDRRLRTLRTKQIDGPQVAEYYQLLRDHDWYYRVKTAIREARGGSATATQHIFTLLNERVDGQIKDIEQQTLDNLRVAGSGALPTSENETFRKIEKEIQYDKEFLKSCGIKGETW